MMHCPKEFHFLLRRSLKWAVFLLFVCLLPFHSSALLDYETDLNLDAEWNQNHVEDDECPEAWPVDCEEGSGGNSQCGGWRILKDLAQSETWPGDNQATCSTGVRLGLNDRQQTQGQAVGAMFSGTVLFAQSGRSRDGKDYGGVIVLKLDLDDGSPQCFARYMFLDRRDMARVGTKVTAGQRIGSIASDDMSPTKRWWEENWGASFPPQVKIDIGCDEALVNLPHFMPKEPYQGGGPEDANSCPLTKVRFPTPPILYITKRAAENVQCKVGIRTDARKFKAAPPQDDKVNRTKLNAYWLTNTVKPRGVIRQKSTPVYALFSNEVARNNLYGANPNAETVTPIMRKLDNYRDATALGCDNMTTLFKGKNGDALSPEEVRELLNHCTNQFILGRSMNPTVQESRGSVNTQMKKILKERLFMFLDEDVQEDYRSMLEENKTENEIYDAMEDEVAKVFFRDHCQPLAMQRVSFKDYDARLILTKAWNELLIDWPEENELSPIDRVSIDPIDINSYTKAPYEKIIDPSHPFSPRHIFAETERERYSNYGVQCAATPVDIILGTYGETRETQRTYGKRDQLFHQCISCRIEINERENAACFADPYSFRTLGGCPNGLSQGGTICDNLPREFAEPLTRLSMEYGMRRDFLEFILMKESSCAALGREGECFIGFDGWGTGFWQIDRRPGNHPLIEVDKATYNFPSSNARARELGIVGENACDFYYGGRYALAYISENAKTYDCIAPVVAASYNGGPGGANALLRHIERKNGDWNAVIRDLEAENIPNMYWPTHLYVLDALKYFGQNESICLEGGPYTRGQGPTTGGTGSGDFQYGNVFGNGQTGGQGPGGTSIAPTGERFTRVTGAEVVRTGLQRFKGRPYSMTGPRLDPEGATTDCSGFVILSTMAATGFPLSRYATYTENLKSWAKYRENSISEADARKTPGALLGLGAGAGGSAHVGFSVGDGTAAETGSQEGRFVGCSKFDYNSWQFYYKFPDWLIDYDPERNQPIEGLCNMIQNQEQGICRYALPVETSGHDDLTPPDYLTDYTPRTVTMPNPPSAKRGDPFDLEVPGMVYEGAWRACTNLPAQLRQECERINEELAEERRERANVSITRGNGEMTHPAPCSTITPGRIFTGDHSGIDYAAPGGHPIVAVADGTVESAWTFGGKTTNRGSIQALGTGYEIRHANGEKSRYYHMSESCGFREGDTVRQGEVIGYVGDTGYSFGDHLHFELRDQQGNAFNPIPRLPSENQPPSFCSDYVNEQCNGDIGSRPLVLSGPTLCIDKPCSVRYDEADVVAQCAYPSTDGGCGTLGNFAQSNRGGENGDCCFYITAPVTPMNHLKLRPGFDNEVPVTGSDDPEEYAEGAWLGARTRDTVREATEEQDPYWGEGGQVDVSDANPGAPEGYSFHEWFRNHRPFMRWWDTGAESGSILQETTEADAPWGMYDTLVGVGIEKQNCGFGGWGETNRIDPNSSWMELKLYQARTLYLGSMRCIGRYEQHFTARASEDFLHRLAGGDFSSERTSKIVNWPLSWRGYVSDTDADLRFPAYLDKDTSDPLAEAAMVGTGMDNAMPGDILVYDWDVVERSRLPHIAYVLQAETIANMANARSSDVTADVSWFKRAEQGELPQFVVVEEYNFGKYPDACGNTNWLGNSVERRLYKTSIPTTDRQRASANRVADTNCDNPDITACVEPLWDRVKIYRPANHVRRR